MHGTTLGFVFQTREDEKMKTALITLSAATFIATAPAVLARNESSKAPHQHHQVSKKHPPNISGYAPSAPKDYTSENSRNAGGGGGM
jgi:hypothetical protein